MTDPSQVTISAKHTQNTTELDKDNKNITGGQMVDREAMMMEMILLLHPII